MHGNPTSVLLILAVSLIVGSVGAAAPMAEGMSKQQAIEQLGKYADEQVKERKLQLSEDGKTLVGEWLTKRVNAEAGERIPQARIEEAKANMKKVADDLKRRADQKGTNIVDAAL